MTSGSGMLVLIGAVGLVSWMLAGIIGIVGYSHTFKSSTGSNALFSTAFFILGAILEMVMIVGIVAGV